MPLAQAFALYAAIAARYDMTPTGPTYQDRALLAAARAAAGPRPALSSQPSALNRRRRGAQP